MDLKVKTVHRYSLDGTYERSYSTTTKAANDLGINEWAVRKPLKKKTYKLFGNCYLSRFRKENLFHDTNTQHKVSVPQAKVLLLDIETSPMVAFVWSMWENNVSQDQLIHDWFIISWSAKWLMDGVIYSACVTPEEALAKDDHRIMLPLWQLMNEADYVIGHNSASFDVPKINTRFILNGLLPPSSYGQIDTKRAVTGGTFKFSSNKLEFLSSTLFNKHKIRTEFKLWSECLAGNKASLDQMVEYNRYDVILLEELYLKIRPWIKAHPNLGRFEEGDGLRCSYCGHDKLTYVGEYHTTVHSYESHRCAACGGISRSTKPLKPHISTGNRTLAVAH